MKQVRKFALGCLILAAGSAVGLGSTGLVEPEELSGLDLLSDSRVSFAPGVSPELSGTALILRSGTGQVAPLMSIRLAESTQVPTAFDMRACMRMTRRGGDWDPGFGIGDLDGVASIVFADNFGGIANSQDWVFQGGGAGCSTSGPDCPTNSDRILTGVGYPAIGEAADFGARWTVAGGRVVVAGAQLAGAESEISVDLPLNDSGGLDLVFVANDDGEVYEIHSVRIGIGCGEPIPAEMSFTSSGDTYLKQGQPNKNQGTETILRVRKSGKNRGLVHFDAAALGSELLGRNVTSATLTLEIVFNANNWGDGRDVGAYRMLEPWTELGATWNCPIDTNTSNQNPDWVKWDMKNGLPFSASPTDTVLHTKELLGTIEFDVTADVAAFASGAHTHLGWILKKVVESQNGHVRYSSREGATPPRLDVVYQ
ncbi:MAG: DNRLRE domain-containing protein [Acidobacteria bacterium]|nr:DNRLRE domain-containing protein [Acidobacteriota bacterium]